MTAFQRPAITFSARSAGSIGSLLIGIFVGEPAMVTSWSAGEK
jgi:hypothetical protein